MCPAGPCNPVWRSCTQFRPGSVRPSAASARRCCAWPPASPCCGFSGGRWARRRSRTGCGRSPGRRAGALERLCGQVIQAVVTAVVLLTLPSPVRPALPYVLAGVAGVAGCAALVVRGAARRGRSRLTRAARAVSADLRHGLLAPGVWPQLTLASVLVVAGHTATFVIAARVARSTASLGELVALLMVVQTVMVIPLSIGGWGLRGGVAAPGLPPPRPPARPP